MRLNMLSLAALAALAALPAAAQEQSTADLVAIVTGGLVDGSQSLFGTLKGEVKKGLDGVYEINLNDGGAPAMMAYRPLGDCVFEVSTYRANSSPFITGVFDFNKVTAINVQDQGPWEGLNAYLVMLEGADAVQMPDPQQGGKLVTIPGYASLVTSIEQSAITDAIGKLRAICPGA